MKFDIQSKLLEEWGNWSMGEEVKKFYQRGRYAKIVFSLISRLFWLNIICDSWLLPHRTESNFLKIIFILYILSTIVIIVGAIYGIISMKKDKIPDIWICNEKIGLSFAHLFKRKVKWIYTKDIIALDIPKWDDEIEITIRDTKKRIVNLFGFRDEDIIQIKDSLREIKSNIQTKI